MTDLPTAPGRFRISGWHVLAGVVAFFAIVIGVDGWFAAMAVRTFPGEVSSTPYEDGVAYNRKLAQLSAQAQLGWRAAAAATPDGALLVKVRDRTGVGVSGLKVLAKLERPATEAGRIVPAFSEHAPGDYLARPGRLAGTWDFTFVLHDPQGRRFEGERRLSWR